MSHEPGVISDDRPWDDSVDNPPDLQLVTIAHACFDFARAGDTERLLALPSHGFNLHDVTEQVTPMDIPYRVE